MTAKLDQATNWEKLARECRYRLSDAARLLGISVRTLERHFSERYHTTPSRYFAELKIRDIEHHVAEGRNGKEIIDQTGFAHCSSLSRFLKHENGNGLRSSRAVDSRRKMLNQSALYSDNFDENVKLQKKVNGNGEN